MKVYKFGGTSVGSPANMKMVASIINTAEPKIIVLSALSGTTNSLVGIAEAYLNQNIRLDTDALEFIPPLPFPSIALSDLHSPISSRSHAGCSPSGANS